MSVASLTMSWSTKLDFMTSYWLRDQTNLSLTPTISIPSDLITLLSKYSKPVVNFDCFDSRYAAITNTKEFDLVTFKPQDYEYGHETSVVTSQNMINGASVELKFLQVKELLVVGDIRLGYILGNTSNTKELSLKSVQNYSTDLKLAYLIAVFRSNYIY